MKVYIQKSFDGEYATVNNAVAMDGFRQMGWEICHYRHGRDLHDSQADEVVVGYIGDVRAVWLHLGVALPEEINYPSALQPFLGRKIWTSTINTIANNPDKWGVFIKPMRTAKKFTGLVVRSTQDLIGCGDQGEDSPVFCSEPVRFVREWRCFVRYGQILDLRPYKGDWRREGYDYRVIEQAVAAYGDAPKAYAIDFGVTDDGRTLLVEVNDGYAIGAYGLFPLTYAKFLSARWAEVTGTEDYCAFDQGLEPV